MEKIYSKKSIGNPEKLEPKEETINFLLNYSKALKVLKYNNLEFETLLN
jgi:hypothetical protein